MITASDIAKALGGKKSGKGWICKCPNAHAHKNGDKKPGFSVTDKSGGGILIKCFGGCSQEDGVAKLKEMNLWPEAPAKIKSAPQDRRIVQTYDYNYDDGTLAFQCVRFEPKDFQQRQKLKNGEWLWKLDGIDIRPLYRQDLVRQAVQKKLTVVICEGEKDVDNAVEHLKVKATTNVSGGMTWRKEYTDALKGCKRVVILPDNDPVGEKRVAKLGPLLTNAGIEVRVLRLPGLPDKGDLTDWIGAGGTPEKFRDLVEAAPVWKEEPTHAEQVAASGEVISETDMANGRRLVKLHGERIRFTDEKGFAAWDINCWKFSRTIVRRYAEETAIKLMEEVSVTRADRRQDLFKHAKRSQQMAGIRAMVEAAESHPSIQAKVTDFDANAYIVNCQNGVLHLLNDEVVDHEPRFMCSVILGLRFNAKAVCPMWISFLDTIMDGNEEKIGLLKRLAGYSLCGDAGEQIAPFLLGRGANGKTVFVEALQQIMGPYACGLSKESLILKHDHGIRQDIAKLSGKRMVVVDEFSEGEWLDEGMFKTLTGENTLTARFMRENEINFECSFTLWMQGNALPQIRDTTDGVWRRLLPIRFPIQIAREKRIKGFRKQLVALEGEGILRWMKEGFQEYRERGVDAPDEILNERAEYRNSSDPFQAFLEEECLVTAQGEDKRRYGAVFNSLYDAHKKWCEDNGHKAISVTRFGTMLVDRGFEKDRDRLGRKKYWGIALKGKPGESDHEQEYAEDVSA